MQQKPRNPAPALLRAGAHSQRPEPSGWFAECQCPVCTSSFSSLPGCTHGSAGRRAGARGGRRGRDEGPGVSCARQAAGRPRQCRRPSILRRCAAVQAGHAAAFSLRTYRRLHHLPPNPGGVSVAPGSWQQAAAAAAQRNAGASPPLPRRSLSHDAPAPTATMSSTLAQRQAGSAARLFD